MFFAIHLLVQCVKLDQELLVRHICIRYILTTNLWCDGFGFRVI